MGHRAIYIFKDKESEKKTVYHHWGALIDKIPDRLKGAARFAWGFPRFEADEFAAAFCASVKYEMMLSRKRYEEIASQNDDPNAEYQRKKMTDDFFEVGGTIYFYPNQEDNYMDKLNFLCIETVIITEQLANNDIIFTCYQPEYKRETSPGVPKATWKEVLKEILYTENGKNVQKPTIINQ
jgi:hypothetical protein